MRTHGDNPTLMIEPAAFEDLAHHVARIDPTTAGSLAAAKPRCWQAGSVAVVSLVGLIGPRRGFPAGLMGGTDVHEAIEALDAVSGREDVAEVLLAIDSPGGAMQGAAELAEAVWRVRDHKPVLAHVEGVAAGVGFWAALHAEVIHASPTALIGGLGSFATFCGRPHLRTGEGLRIAGLPAASLSSPGSLGRFANEALAMNTRILKSLEIFRCLDRERAERVTTGQLWPASEALELGLIDRIGSMRETLKGQAA